MFQVVGVTENIDHLAVAVTARGGVVEQRLGGPEKVYSNSFVLC
jgi:hypothetical protein